MLNANVTIINKLGLHARAAALLSSTAARYASDIKLSINDKRVDAKSVMSLMLLAATKGTDVLVEVEGNDQEEALDAVVTLINNRFNEEE